MEDIQNSKNLIRLKLERVGIKSIKYPIILKDKKETSQSTIADVSLFVDLPARQRGTHMSRFIEILNKYSTIYLDSKDWSKMLHEMIKKFTCKRAHLNIKAPYFIKKYAPRSKKEALMKIDTAFYCSLNGKHEQSIIEIIVPVTTLCPCSKAISSNGAHSQRAYTTLQVILNEFIWIEDLVELIESKASSPIFPLLKRADEKYVTEKAYANPVFVEDLVRKVSKDLIDNPRISWFHVEVESNESIHDHQAYACFTWGKKKVMM